MLKSLLDQEFEESIENPKKAHEAALKNAGRVVAKYADKLLLESDGDHKNLLMTVMKSNATHYRFQLERISSSAVVADESLDTIEMSDNLLSALSEMKVDATNFNASMHNLENLDTSVVESFVENNMAELDK